MCYDLNARPPFPPIAGGAANGEDIILTAKDGTRFSAYIARADESIGARVLIYPDVRGLHQFYKELALRFAAFTPGVHTCIVATTNLDHLKENMAIIEKGPLADEMIVATRSSFKEHDHNWIGQI